MRAKFRAVQSTTLTGAPVAEMTEHPVHLKLRSDSETPVLLFIPYKYTQRAYLDWFSPSVKSSSGDNC